MPFNVLEVCVSMVIKYRLIYGICHEKHACGWYKQLLPSHVFHTQFFCLCLFSTTWHTTKITFSLSPESCLRDDTFSCSACKRADGALKNTDVNLGLPSFFYCACEQVRTALLVCASYLSLLDDSCSIT